MHWDFGLVWWDSVFLLKGPWAMLYLTNDLTGMYMVLWAIEMLMCRGSLLALRHIPGLLQLGIFKASFQGPGD